MPLQLLTNKRSCLFHFKADTVKSLEKENMKLIEALGDMEEATREDKKKIRSMEENVVKEREKVLEQINITVNEVISSNVSSLS